ncbi:hypothetical protein BKA69DRAFT_1086803 [Paraphysoderma sedebokerense]|nr:hypothetical protein BKA69DRAFT_1086803 [Paraphysoderma sedebokerense]
MSSPPPIVPYIERACHQDRFEPDLALNLEICDIINTKQRTYPRDAAMAIVRLVNHRLTNVGGLALTLLDNCVKNCGYPFQLQIAQKDFLNELVRKFPDKPPALPTQNMLRILEMIQTWHVTLCKTSKYKDDLANISDMYRLLGFKGYRFPGVAESAVSVLAGAPESLKSADEMEAEDRMIKQAKLQELLRRATPADLEEANQLMKDLSGYEPDKKVDYKAKEKEELDKIEHKAMLLNDMLSNCKPGENISKNDALQELYGACKSNQPRIQKFIEEGDEEKDLERLLSLNDTLNLVLDRYNDVKAGKTPSSLKLAKSAAAANDAPSLIDFGGESSGSDNVNMNVLGQGMSNSSSGVVDALAGLSLQLPPQPSQSSSEKSNTTDLLADLFGPAPVTSTLQPTNTAPMRPTHQGFPTQTNQSPAFPNIQAFPPMPNIMSASAAHLASMQPFQQVPANAMMGANDSRKPANPQPASHPGGFQNFETTSTATGASNNSNTDNLFDIFGGPGSVPTSVQPAQNSPPKVSPTAANMPATAATREVPLYNKNGLLITLNVSSTKPEQYDLVAKFSNTTLTPMMGLALQIAVPKVRIRFRMYRLISEHSS